MPEVITGLSCPNCAGSLTIQEGQRLVKCPYCQARSLVRGERGVRRYQVPRRTERDGAANAVRGFWSGLNRAPDLRSTAQVNELFLVYLPYWRLQAQAAGWIFGRKKYRSNKTTRWVPKEVQIMEAVAWTGAAADVAEFGVERLPLQGVDFAAYSPDALHAEGLVFEPTGSQTEASESAQKEWHQTLRNQTGLDEIGQAAVNFLRQTRALVYYPLWVGRYGYRGRSYQVVVDGCNGRVLYGKAPGNVFYRALMLVAATAAGAFLIVDGTALALALMSNSDSEVSLIALLVPLVVGAGLIAAGYRLFRWGEEIEHRAKAGP